MADGQTTYSAGREFVPEFDDVDGFKFISCEKAEEMDSFVNCQRSYKRSSKQPLSFTTLSLTKDPPASFLKKRNRKDNKRVVVDKLDGFTFVSAFTLNDFDSYENNSVKLCCGPPGSTKRKSSTKIAKLETTNKKPRISIDSTSENIVRTSASSIPEITIVASFSATDKVRPSLTTNKPTLAFETVSSASTNKNLSPLTKSALVRLKKINVSSLNQNKNISRTEQDSDKDHGKVNEKTILENKAKKSINLKVPYMEINKLNLNVADTSKKPKISPVVVSDREDNLELDVCTIDESSSSQFILDNLKTSEEKASVPVLDSKLKNEEKSKPKRKPCQICCLHPCRIVGAKRIKSSENLFPSFDVSFTSTCQVHLPGEVIVDDSSAAKGSVDVSIQATATDIKMHHDFAKRFPYRVISVLSCQPRQDEVNLPEVSLAESSERFGESRRIVEQKRREELHGLYIKLAETLAISKVRASKLWILENALKEIRCLEAESTFLTAKLNLEKEENKKLRKRWEELSGKPYVPAEENIASKVATKSKLLELYEKYRKDVRWELQTKPSQEEENLKSNQEEKNEARKEVCKMDVAYEKRSEVCLPWIPITEAEKILKSSNSLMKLSQTVSRIEDNYQSTPTHGYLSKDKQPISTDELVTTAKHTSTGPRLIVRPFQHKPVPFKSLDTPTNPKIDLTNAPEASTPKLSQMLKGNSISVKTTTNEMTQVKNSPPFKSPPATRSSALLTATEMCSTSNATDQSAVLPTSTRSQFKQLSSPSSVTAPNRAQNNEFVIISMMVKGRPMIFRIPKTAEGLTLLSQISLMKRLSPESMTKIAEKFVSSTKTGHTTCKVAGEASSHSTVNTCQTTTPAKPTQWSTLATGQNPIVSPQTPTQCDTQFSSTPNVTCYNDITQQQKQLIVLDVTSKENPIAKTFAVVPTSSSINLTLNKLGSISVNNVLNRSPTASEPLTNLSKASDHQTLNQTVPRIILPKTVPFANIPSSLSYTRAPSCRPPTNVHMYQPQIPPDPSCQFETIPRISDSLLQDACQSDQESMNDSGICMISNVFSLTDTAVGETSNTFDKSAEVKVVDAAITGSAIQSPNVLGSSSTRGDGDGE